MIADGVTQDGADYLIRPIPGGPIGMKILEQVIHRSSSLWCFVSLPPGEDDRLIIDGGAPVVCYAEDGVGVTFGTPMTPGVAVWLGSLGSPGSSRGASPLPPGG